MYCLIHIRKTSLNYMLNLNDMSGLLLSFFLSWGIINKSIHRTKNIFKLYMYKLIYIVSVAFQILYLFAPTKYFIHILINPSSAIMKYLWPMTFYAPLKGENQIWLVIKIKNNQYPNLWESFFYENWNEINEGNMVVGT